MTQAPDELDFILPILTYPDATPSGGLHVALAFAATMGARITALAHEVDIPPIHNVVAEALLKVSAVSAEVEADSRKRGAALTQELQQRASTLGLEFDSLSLRCRIELMPGEVAVAARTYDLALLVVDSESAERPQLPEAVLFGSGGGSIFIPTHAGDILLDSVAIAWDGSRAAARAVRDAMPMLKLAGKVCILTFEDEKPGAARGLAELQRFLGRRGIESQHLTGSVGATTIGDAIQDRALQQQAGIVVMGGYGHSRFQEIVLGGATRTVLQRLRMPVLMSR